jgi:membrane-bound lytic murein transglycosylase D
MRAAILVLGYLCAAGMPVSVAHAQTTWRTDSLMGTWYVQQQLKELRSNAGKGVVRAVSTKDLYTRLRKEAPGIPVFADSAVIRYTDLYGEPQRESFQVVLGMTEVYFPMIEKELSIQGLPNELKDLPMALSAMNTQAGSSTGGAGIWMLPFPVALRYGLVVTSEVDERLDDIKSTMVAGRYLKDLHAKYQDWGLAVMAFACGPANVTRAQQRHGGATDYRSLYPHFTEGQQDVLPLLMAFIHLATNAGSLGIETLPVCPWEPTDEITAPRAVQWNALSQVMQIPAPHLRALNPTLIGKSIPAGHPFRLPAGSKVRFEQLADSVRNVELAQVVEPEPVTVEVKSTVRYRVRPGDSLGKIAEKHHVSVRQLKSWNNLRSDRINAGDVLVIESRKREVVTVKPTRTEVEGEGPTNSTKGSAAKEIVRSDTGTSNGMVQYTVQSGDSLYRIAERFPGVSAQRIMEVNGIDARIMPGQRIKIPNP